MPLRRVALSGVSCVALFAALLIHDAHASAGTISGETNINTSTAGDQFGSANASASNGRSVVVWTHQPPDAGQDSDVRAQIFDANKNPLLPSDLKVAQTRAIESDPAVGMDDSGNFVVVWTRRADAAATNSNVVGARFNLTGARLGSLTVAASSRIEFDPAVAAAGDGDLVVTYTRSSASSNRDVFARLYTGGGTFIKTLVVANSASQEQRSSVARTASGNFVTAYQAGENITLRRFNATGSLLGVHAVANSARAERAPSVDVDDAANAIVVWQERDGDWGIRERRVTNGGSVGSALTVADTAADETRPAATVDRSDGDHAVAYQVGGGTAARVRVTELSVTGVVRGTFDLGPRRVAPAISTDGSDRYMVTYTSTVAGSGDPGRGIFGRVGLVE